MRLWGLLISLILIGCASTHPHQAYDGPLLPDAKHAKITGEAEKHDPIWVGSNKRVAFVKVDGKPLAFIEISRNLPTSILLTPGRHDIEVSFTYLGLFARHEMTVDVQAGRSYLLRRTFTEPIKAGNTVQFWLEDITEGQAKIAE